MNSSSSRVVFLLGLLLAAAPALAQDYAGTWVARHPNGGTVTLKLEQQGPGEVIGTLEGNGASFEVDAEIRADGLVGMVSGTEAMVYLTGRLAGATLQVMLVEPGPGGQPNMQTARQIMFARESAPRPAAKKQESNRQDQLTQLLTRSAWCSFTYNQRTGTSTRERVVFRGDGIVQSQAGAETYSSGPAGSVAGDHRSGKQARWRVADNTLHLSEDGATWEPQALQITQNSNGTPIIKSGAKEYAQCN